MASSTIALACGAVAPPAPAPAPPIVASAPAEAPSAVAPPKDPLLALAEKAVECDESDLVETTFPFDRSCAAWQAWDDAVEHADKAALDRHVLALVGSPDARLRHLAVDVPGFSSTFTEDDAARFLAAVAQEKSPVVAFSLGRASAAIDFEKLGASDAFEKAVLLAPAAYRRGLALASLDAPRTATTLAALRILSEGPDPGQRVATAEALSATARDAHDAAACALLSEILSRDDDGAVYAADAAARSGCRDIEPAIVKTLSRWVATDPEAGDAGVSAMTTLASLCRFGTLSKPLRRETSRILDAMIAPKAPVHARVWTIPALPFCDPDHAARRLEALSKDPEGEVAAMASRELARLKAQKAPPAPSSGPAR